MPNTDSLPKKTIADLSISDRQKLSLHDKWTVNTPLELSCDSPIHPRVDEVVLTTWCRSLCDDVCWADQNWQALDIDIQV